MRFIVLQLGTPHCDDSLDPPSGALAVWHEFVRLQNDSCVTHTLLWLFEAMRATGPTATRKQVAIPGGEENSARGSEFPAQTARVARLLLIGRLLRTLPLGAF